MLPKQIPFFYLHRKKLRKSWMVVSRDSSPLVWCSSRCSRGQTDALEQIEIKKVTQLQVTRLSQFASMSRRRREKKTCLVFVLHFRLNCLKMQQTQEFFSNMDKDCSERKPKLSQMQNKKFELKLFLQYFF